ncbi:hypothetical protein A9798_15855 [Edwardsiella hoshinae]|uniref:Uncharacterized protein n=1 Tax=Edwardsiella hoshinae TaxID=93378 RepID=A0ABM6EMU0_9GAMM|nr:hypothetical protein A9798_15855 [Edwardsiella hoshinae]
MARDDSNENVCVKLVKFLPSWVLWITLCVIRYKLLKCCVMRQSVFLRQNSGCTLRNRPYNAPPSTRHL